MITKLKVGAKTYKIRYDDLIIDDGDVGSTHHSNGIIRIASNQTETEKEITLLHEILHTCCNFVGIKGKLTEEEFVTKLSPILHTVLKENNIFR